LTESILDELIRAHATDRRDGVASGFSKNPAAPKCVWISAIRCIR
jgi:hypothetical protein